MLALSLLLALSAQAAPIQHIKLEAQRYAGSPSEIAKVLEGDLARHLAKVCGESGDMIHDKVKIHQLDLRVVPMGGWNDSQQPLHGIVIGGDDAQLLINDYPRGELEASFECT